MGKTDIALTSYLASPHIFADLFNAWIFGGKQIIDPQELKEENPVQSRPEYASPYKHVRDVVKLVCWHGVELMLLGIEQQEQIDYSAPVRTMQYDGADYQKKIRRIEEENRKKLGLKTSLPAFFPEDRITPVITLILYFGEKEWRRPRSLHDLLSFPEDFEELRSLVPDYPIHVVSVRTDMDIGLLHTELRQVFGFLQRQEDRTALRQYVTENKAVFSHISRDAALFLAAAAKGTQLLNEIDAKEENYDMCKALDDIYNDGKLEGISMGINQGISQGISMGINQGISLGLTQGEDRFADLSEYLLNSARLEDLKRAITDKAYRNTLYQECGLTASPR